MVELINKFISALYTMSAVAAVHVVDVIRRVDEAITPLHVYVGVGDENLSMICWRVRVFCLQTYGSWYCK